MVNIHCWRIAHFFSVGFSYKQKKRVFEKVKNVYCHILYCERSSLSYRFGRHTASFLVLLFPQKINTGNKKCSIYLFCLNESIMYIALYWRLLCTFTSVMYELYMRRHGPILYGYFFSLVTNNNKIIIQLFLQ